ncbi:MAG TPA: hypothetical protein DG048_11265 [Pseudoalteromonas sp.]|nr:hypothetical protein [Pseudoalteromonas sp.]|tara:strand:+ start:6746 stop:7105 length:360 start_codon:yes stop_codon:yes gene_type:complete
MVPIKLDVQDILDILCTAFNGGVEYWCEYVRGHGGDTSRLPGKRNKVAYEYEWLAIGGSLEIGVDGEVYTLTQKLLQDGLWKWFASNDCKLSFEKLRNIDAGDADSIIQYSLFGELRYN